VRRRRTGTEPWGFRHDPTEENDVSQTWPNRETWAQQRRTTYADDVDKVVEMVSSDPADYATRAEILQASAELGEHWRSLGRELRVANAAACVVFPMHNHRARRRASIVAILRLRDLLSDSDRAIVEHAEAVKHHRQLVNAAADQLAGAEHGGRLDLWTVDNAARWMPAGTAPTWKAIVSRWKAAREQAGVEHSEQVRDRPVDDAAWRKELRRRVEIESARLNGHVRRYQS
jgi:hypothetical protein